MQGMKVSCSVGTAVPYEEFMALINDVFGFTGTGRDFRTLLPKLYRPGRSPQCENYVVTEDGRCVAAVGAFSHKISVCGITLPCRGIGNVAVASEARGRGYMKDCMHLALSDMVKDGIALSTLGGRRQRYRYFSYEKAGLCYTFVLNSDNLRHTYGAERGTRFALSRVEPGDASCLDRIMALSATGPYVPLRPATDFYDIMTNWQATLWAGWEGDTLAGYAIVEPDGLVSEIKVQRPEDFMAFLADLHDALTADSMRVRLPAHQAAYVDALSPVAEGVQVGCSMSYTVLNYRLVTEAFFRLKATFDPLPDGSFDLLIHGFAGDERFRMTVGGGVPVTEDADPTQVPDLELSHEEAMSVLFAPVCPARRQLPPTLRLWLPLPIWMYRADEV